MSINRPRCRTTRLFCCSFVVEVVRVNAFEALVATRPQDMRITSIHAYHALRQYEHLLCRSRPLLPDLLLVGVSRGLEFLLCLTFILVAAANKSIPVVTLL
jgi:hypothetical protein